MQRGMKPFRVYAHEGSARDLEAKDMADAHVEAARNLLKGARGIKRIEPLPPDEVRRYDVLFAALIGTEGFIPVPPEVLQRRPVQAKSSLEATKIAQAEIDMGIVPDAELMQAMILAANAVPLDA